eukprot:Gb_32533 [translate_table: standard]
MLKRVHEWAQKWGMACGIDKCKAMVVFRHQDSLKLEELLIGEDKIGVVVEGIKWMVGKSANLAAVGAAVFHRELNVCSIAAFNARQRARGFFKYRGLNTWIVDLVNLPSEYIVGEKWSWVHRTKKWIAKHAPRCQNQGLLVRDAVWELKRAVRLEIVDHRIGARCLLWNKEGADSFSHVLIKCPSLVHIRSRIEGKRFCNWLRGRLQWRGIAGFVHIVNLLAEVIPVYNQASREWEVQGDGSQRSLVEGPLRSDTTFEPMPERVGPTFHQGTQWSRMAANLYEEMLLKEYVQFLVLASKECLLGSSSLVLSSLSLPYAFVCSSAHALNKVQDVRNVCSDSLSPGLSHLAPPYAWLVLCLSSDRRPALVLVAGSQTSRKNVPFFGGRSVVPFLSRILHGFRFDLIEMGFFEDSEKQG